MAVVAKVAPASKPVSLGAERVVNGTVSINPGDNIALSISPDTVASYSRQGLDLMVQLKSGETVRIANFFGLPENPSHLFLIDKDQQLLSASLPNSVSEGALAAGYAPVGASANFATLAAAEGAAVGVGGGIGVAGIVGGIAAAAGGLAVAAGGGSDDDDKDTTPPGSVTSLSLSADGIQLTGRAEAGATVRIDVDGDGEIDATATAASDGSFTVMLDPPLLDGEMLIITARDAAGNISDAVTMLVPDLTAPAVATRISFDVDGSAITGDAAPGTTVSIDLNGDGQIDASGVTNTLGHFRILLNSLLIDGEEVSVTVTDLAGNSSAAVTAIAPDLVPTPALPTIFISNGIMIAGTAEPGNIVTVIAGAETLVGQAIVDANGNWSITPSSPLLNGTVITVVITNSEGQSGPSASLTIDTFAPDVPTIDPSNGVHLTGTVEAGATVTLTSGGIQIGTVIADANGRWTFTPAQPLADGAIVTANAIDPAGNASPAVTITIDAIPPAAPTIELTNGVHLVGTAEAGSTVTLLDSQGAVIGTATVDVNGNWDFTPATPLINGLIVNAIATDAAGNVSQPASTTIDSSLPSIPLIDPSNGTVINGTADAGNSVTITDGSGNFIGQATVDGSGHFSILPSAPLANGTVLLVTAENTNGVNSSAFTSVVDAIAPAAPIFDPSNGGILDGMAEAGATVTLTVGGNSIGTAIVDSSGHWAFTPPTPLADGIVVTATARDAAGNVSAPVTTIVDSIAPAAPVIAPSNGTVLTGTAEPGSVVTLAGLNGAIGIAVTSSSGVWNFIPSSPIAHGTVITATAIDAAENVSVSASVTIDAVAPAAPLIDPSAGTVLNGTAEAGAIVTLSEGNTVLGAVTADINGNWSFTPLLPLVNGTVVIAVASDAAANQSASASLTVDSMAPLQPVITPTNGAVIAGIAEPGSTITLLDGNGNPIGTTTVNGMGQWSFTPASPLANGVVINATARDGTGNVSSAASLTVDSLAPAVPTIDPSRGSLLAGTAEPGATIIITNGSGTTLGTVSADITGHWSFIPSTPLADAAVVNVVAVDLTGNISAAATRVIDALAPAAPLFAVSNGAVVSGTAEANTTVRLTDYQGNPIGQATVNGAGNWSFTPSVPLPNGAIIQGVVTDAAGNVSLPSAVTIDALAPVVPTINPTNGALLAGNAEAGATITLLDGNGNPLGTVSADTGGHWNFTPSSPLANGLVVTVSARDAAGNISTTATTTVDSVAPGAPVISPSSGTRLVGTAEAGATVILTAGGNTIGTVIANANGNWSFTPIAPLVNATVINATATDAAGNVSAVGTVTVDTSLPSIPAINPSNGLVVTGMGDIGNTITLRDGNGALIGTATVDGTGHWSITPIAPLSNATMLTAVAENSSGTLSAPSFAIVDAVAPANPIIDPSNGAQLAGTAEASALVTLRDNGGNTIGTVTADTTGHWTFTPSSPLANAAVITATATDAAGNISGTTSGIVDALAPNAPIISASNGVILTGTAEAGALITLVTGTGIAIGQVVADGSGNWAFAPSTALANNIVVNATATDAAGNVSANGTVTVDALPPVAPTNLLVQSDGTVLTGSAEPNTQVRIVVGGDTAHPIIAAVNVSGNFSVTLSPPLIAAENLSVTAVDAANNVSPAAFVEAPDLAPLAVTVAEAADGYVNAAEMSDGVQVSIGLTPGTDAGDTLTTHFAGPNGYVADQSHVITAAERASGIVNLTLTPPGGGGSYPQGPASLTAYVVGGSQTSNTVNFTVDTVPPATPVLSLLGNLLSISTTPGSGLNVLVDIGGVVANATVMANGSGQASLDLLTGLNIGLSWDQLLDASVSVRGVDQAGNVGNVAMLDVAASIDPITLGDFALQVGVVPPALGFSGTVEDASSLRVNIVTPAATATVHPLLDANGHYSVNLLSPSVLSQLGVSVGGLLALGSSISLDVVATDAQGHDSANYGINLTGSGALLGIGGVTITGTGGTDLISAASGAETINAGGGSDLILHVGAGDHANAGAGNDAISLAATNFANVDGGTGFDTVIFENGIDIDYNGPGVGTLSNIERVDLGTGDSGSVLTLTAAEVDAVTDANNVLQITGEANDTLNVIGAVDTGTSTTINGLAYHVYTFGTTTLQVEENSVTVVH